MHTGQQSIFHHRSIPSLEASPKSKPDLPAGDFMGCERRFNVAVTRAESLLVVVGDEEYLKGKRVWRTLVNNIKRNGGYLKL